jgi:N-methylhydantoinase B
LTVLKKNINHRAGDVITNWIECRAMPPTPAPDLASRRAAPTGSALDIPLIAGRLAAAVDEAAARLVRTAFSTIIRDANDYVCLLLDANGDSIAENATAIPAFNGCLPKTARALVAKVGTDGFRSGDAFITNDPWIGTGHLYDACLLNPLFMHDRFVGFTGSVAHVADIGGSLWGVDTATVYEEGLRIPLGPIRREGQLNEQLLEIIQQNVRVPDETLGDIHALINANDVMAERVRKVLNDEGRDNLTDVGTAICEAAEHTMRAAIRAVPNGNYESEVELDGFDDPLVIRCQISIRDDQIVVDYAGSSPQQRLALNVPLNNTFAITAYVIKCILDPQTPRNEGTYRPIDVTAPAGSLLNASHPAPVNARHLTFLHLASAVMQALSVVIPKKIIAESGSPFIQVVFAGINPRGRPFVHPSFDAPGMGARHDRDGLSATPYPNNTGGAPLEVVERNTGLRYLFKRLVPNSGGAGRYRGGLGTEIAVTWDGAGPVDCSILGDRLTHPARGVLGGAPGLPAAVSLDNARLGAKGRVHLKAGSVLTIRNAGGGGYGDPRQRPQSEIDEDLRLGLVTDDGCDAYR